MLNQTTKTVMLKAGQLWIESLCLTDNSKDYSLNFILRSEKPTLIMVFSFDKYKSLSIESYFHNINKILKSQFLLKTI